MVVYMKKHVAIVTAKTAVNEHSNSFFGVNRRISV